MANNDRGNPSTPFSDLSFEDIYSISEQLNPQVRILVQPAHLFRFRYESEKIKDIIQGATGKYLKIETINFEGKVKVTVSCVTEHQPYRQHPHELRNVDEPDDTGVYSFQYQVTRDNRCYEITNLGLVYVKNKGLHEALSKRQYFGVDPFNSGFDYTRRTKDIDRNAIRLCFEVSFPDNPGVRVNPIVSDVIRNNKNLCPPKILSQNPCSGSVTGGETIQIVCNKVEKDYEVFFYLEENKIRVWEANATITSVDMPTSIKVTTPPFRDLNVTQNVTVQIQVENSSSNKLSHPIPFEYICIPEDLKAIRKRFQDLLNIYQKDADVTKPKLPSLSPLTNDLTSPIAIPNYVTAIPSVASTSSQVPKYRWTKDVLLSDWESRDFGTDPTVTPSLASLPRDPNLSRDPVYNSTAVQKKISPLLENYADSDDLITTMDFGSGEIYSPMNTEDLQEDYLFNLYRDI